MPFRARIWILIFALVGLAAAGAATYVHYKLLTDASYTSFCDINQTVNCETAYKSRFGSVAGIPVALVGALWFVLVLGLTLAWQPSAPATPAPKGKGQPAAPPAPDTGTGIPGYLFLMATMGLAVVLYLAYAAFFVLHTMCVLCLATYAAVIGIFLVSGAATPFRLSELPARLGGDLRRLTRSPVGLSMGVGYVAIVVAALALFPRDGVASVETPNAPVASADTIQADQRSEFERWMDLQTRVPLVIPTDGAKVLIVKFNDYQCPPCRQTFMEYTPLIEKYQREYPGQVKFVTMDFPLDPECNQAGSHLAACEAAAAVRMAKAKGRGEQMERWLFQNQPQMTPELAKEGAKEIGGVADFDAQYPKVLELVKADAALGRQLGVRSTPTFFINGIRIEGGLRPQFFDAAIAHELKK